MSQGTRLQLVAASGTHIGRVRTTNEDTVFSWVSGAGPAPTGLLIVADGLGGHQAGEVASAMAVETVTHILVPLLENGTARMGSADWEERVRAAMREANSAIYRYSGESLSRMANMGTTVACVVVQGERAIVAYVGDSRVYLLQPGASELRLLTRDHTRVWELVEAGQIDPQAALDHPQRNVLTRSLGMRPDVEVDTNTVHFRPGQRLLACSDGLWGVVRDAAELHQALAAAATPEQAVDALIELANARGGDDNIGVVVCDLRAA